MIAFGRNGEARRLIAAAPRRLQFSLRSLMWLTFGVAVFFAQVTSFPLLFSRTGLGTFRALISILVAWSVLLVIYYRRRSALPLLAHCIGPLLMAILLTLIALNPADRKGSFQSLEEAMAISYVAFLGSELASVPMFLYQLSRPARRVPMRRGLTIRTKWSGPRGSR